MSSNHLSRRELLRQAGQAGLAVAAGPALAPFAWSRPNRPPETVKVGILHSLTGNMALNETPLKEAELLALEEINKAGGVLGRRIEPVVEDPESKFTDVFPEKAKKLLLKDKVAAVFGCWTSVSRKNVLPVLEENNGLLFYPVHYEGNEASRNIVYGGAVPSQQVLPALDWLLSAAGGSRKKIYLLGSDYVYPRTVNLVATKYLKTRGLVPVAERYVPLGHRDFATLVEDIRSGKADVVFSTLVGDSFISLFGELASAGLKPDAVPVLSLDLDEDDLRALESDRYVGHLAVHSYFQSVNTAKNKDFVRRYRDRTGQDRVTTESIEAAYTLVYLWKRACEKARSFEVMKVREALRGLEFDAPGGTVKVDAKNQHLWKPCRIGRYTKAKEFDIVFESRGLLPPDPYPFIKEGE